VTKKLVSYLKKLAPGEGGPTAVEYALMMSIIAVVIVAAVTYVGTTTPSTFTTVGPGFGPH
jgi:pilus assembly protein Flp/PilA